MDNEIIRLHVSWRQQYTLEMYQDGTLTDEQIKEYLLKLRGEVEAFLASADEGLDEQEATPGSALAFIRHSDASCFSVPPGGEALEVDYDGGPYSLKVEWMIDNADHDVRVDITDFTEMEPSRARSDASNRLIERGAERERFLKDMAQELQGHPEALEIVTRVFNARNDADHAKYAATYYPKKEEAA